MPIIQMNGYKLLNLNAVVAIVVIIGHTRIGFDFPRRSTARWQKLFDETMKIEIDQIIHIFKLFYNNSTDLIMEKRNSARSPLTMAIISAGNFSSISITFKLAREMGFFMMDYYVPSILIVVISWVSFWLHVDASAPRIVLGNIVLWSEYRC